jgi:hypothetical protein
LIARAAARGPFALAAVLAILAPGPSPGQDVGRTVKGEITAAALRERPRRLTVRLWDGTEVEAHLDDKARITSRPGVWRFASPLQAADLQPGMTVEFKWRPDRVDRVVVLAVPPTARPGGGYDEAAPPSWSGAAPTPDYDAGRELTGRVLDVNVAAGIVTVELNGRPTGFLADPRDLRGLRKGERVVLLTGENGRLASLRRAAPADGR